MLVGSLALAAYPSSGDEPKIGLRAGAVVGDALMVSCARSYLSFRVRTRAKEVRPNAADANTFILVLICFSSGAVRYWKVSARPP